MTAEVINRMRRLAELTHAVFFHIGSHSRPGGAGGKEDDDNAAEWLPPPVHVVITPLSSVTASSSSSTSTTTTTTTTTTAASHYSAAATLAQWEPLALMLASLRGRAVEGLGDVMLLAVDGADPHGRGGHLGLVPRDAKDVELRYASVSRSLLPVY